MNHGAFIMLNIFPSLSIPILCSYAMPCFQFLAKAREKWLSVNIHVINVGNLCKKMELEWKMNMQDCREALASWDWEGLVLSWASCDKTLSEEQINVVSNQWWCKEKLIYPSLIIDKFERRKIFVKADVMRFGNNLPFGVVEGRNLIWF